jgi:hypothetical protein
MAIVKRRALMKKEIAIVLAASLLMGGASVVSAGASQSTKTLRPEPVQTINGEKIPGARNGMLAEMHESHPLSGKYARAPVTKRS